MRLFQQLAADLGARCHVEMLFSESHFAPIKHDAEWLVRIGLSDLGRRLARPDDGSDLQLRELPPSRSVRGAAKRT
jgi:hypothetical protein